MNCKICNNISKEVFSKKVLHKYEVKYYQCSICNFMQTDEPYWLDESYQDAINDTDIGLVSRNKLFSEIVTAQLRLLGFERTRKFLDYGGGYGMFVRMMRDNGFNFYCYDEYCENIYAKKFTDPNPANSSEKYEAVTAFEVFEHLTDPIKEIEKLLAHSDTILFSTELMQNNLNNLENWWYVMPEHGQHVAFYDRKTLEFIAQKYGLNLYTNNHTLHLLTKRKLSKFLYKLSSSLGLSRLYNTILPPKSYLEEDYQLYLNS